MLAWLASDIVHWSNAPVEIWTRVWIAKILFWQIASLYNRHVLCCARLKISAAAQPSLTSFARSRCSRALLLSLNAPNTAFDPDVCSRLCFLVIHDRNQACSLCKKKKKKEKKKKKKRPYRGRCTHGGKTVIPSGRHIRWLDVQIKLAPVPRSLTDSYLQIYYPICVRPSLLTALISWVSLMVAIVAAGQRGYAATVVVVASRAGLSPSLSVTDCGAGSFTLSVLRLMTLSDLPQIGEVQHMGYHILTRSKLILVYLYKNFQSILKLCFLMFSQLETRHLTFVTI